jgi:DNA-binding MarR family transcriptional regulator
MLYPTQEHRVDEVSPAPPSDARPELDDVALAQAVLNLRALIMAGERYRMSVAASVGLGTTESQAISYLAVNGARGQSELARDLSLTSSAATALVDRLEGHGAAERARHPSDRRRTIIRLTERGTQLAAECQAPLRASLDLVSPTDLRVFSSWLGIVADDLGVRTR